MQVTLCDPMWHRTGDVELMCPLYFTLAHRKVLPTASHVYSHRKSIIVVCVLEVLPILSSFARTTSPNGFLSPDAYFVFHDPPVSLYLVY